MISLAVDSGRLRAGETLADRSPASIGHALAAVQRLAGATAAHVLAYDDADGVVRLVAPAAPDGASMVTEQLRVALAAEMGVVLAQSTPRWVRAADGLDDHALLIKLAERQAATLFLLLYLPHASAMSRARLMRQVPDLVMLVKYHVNLSTRLSDAEEARDAAREALDHGECGVIAVRGNHSIVFANAAGSSHLAERRGLCVRRGVIRPVDHAKAIRFEAALDSVIDPGDRRGALARASVMLLDGGQEGRRPTIVVISPAGATAMAVDPARGAAAMIYILAPALGAARGLDTLCRLHGLSRVETLLIANLVQGLTLTEAAGKMRIKVDTARTYLKQVFVKTGLHRQADLVAMMTRYLGAVRGEFDFQPA